MAIYALFITFSLAIIIENIVLFHKKKLVKSYLY